EVEASKKMGVLKSIIFVIGGLTGLFFGGKFLVEGAVDIAKMLGMSEAVIGLTVVAAGTSLPELATSIVAATRKKSDIAIGNVVGSNIFNIFFVLGVSATIRPIPFNIKSNFDLLFLLVASLVMFAFLFIGKQKQINRNQGIFLFLMFVAYTTYLLVFTN
ncbi:MAG: sodium:calcium antiporter, partial [Lentimicrobium sp.]|nr:sodium:calcium antiporter [Lentimicrobium sp.]